MAVLKSTAHDLSERGHPVRQRAQHAPFSPYLSTEWNWGSGLRSYFVR